MSLPRKLRRLRSSRVAARRQWTDAIKDDQVDRGVYRTPEGDEEFRRITVAANQAAFGVRDFGHDRDTMPPAQQTRITQIERVLSGHAQSGIAVEDIEAGLSGAGHQKGRRLRLKQLAQQWVEAQNRIPR